MASECMGGEVYDHCWLSVALGVTTQCIELKRVKNILKSVQFPTFRWKTWFFSRLRMVKSRFECYKNYMSHTFQKQTSPICSYLWNFLILFPSKFSYLWELVKISKKGRKTGKKSGTAPKDRKIHFLGQKSRFRVRFQKIGFLWILDKNLWFFSSKSWDSEL